MKNLLNRSLIVFIAVLLCVASVAEAQQKQNVVKLKTSQPIDGKNVITIWPVTSSGRITVKGATLQDEYADGEPNTYLLTSQEVEIIGDVTALNVDDNQLVSIDVTGNKYIRQLFFANNQVEHIDLSKSQYLITFDCHNNKISNLDFSACPILRIVSIDRNLITEKAMNAIAASVKTESKEPEEKKFWVIDTANENEKNVCSIEAVRILTEKGYKVLDFKGGANNRKGVPYEGSKPTPSVAVDSFVKIEAYFTGVDLLIMGARPNDWVLLFDGNGNVLQRSKASAEGEVSFNATLLPQGFYIVQGSNTSILICK